MAAGKSRQTGSKGNFRRRGFYGIPADDGSDAFIELRINKLQLSFAKLRYYFTA